MTAFSWFFGEKLHEYTGEPIWDSYHLAQPRDTEATFPVIIVSVDEESLNQYGKWPWPRRLIAELIEKISAEGPASIGLDILMPEPEPSPLNWFDADNPGFEELASLLETFPSNDAHLAQVLEDNYVVTGMSIITGKSKLIGEEEVAVDNSEELTESHNFFKDNSCENNDNGTLREFDKIELNIPEFEAAALGHGFYNAFRDEDGVVRKMPLVVKVKDLCIPSLALELYRTALRPFANWYVLQSDKNGNPSSLILDQLDDQGEGVDVKKTIPIRNDGAVRPYFSDKYSGRRIAAHEILDGSDLRLKLNNKIVLVGVTGLGLTDVAAVPVDSDMPGVEIQAQVIENLIANSFLQRPKVGNAVEIILLLIGSIVLIVCMPRVSPFVSACLLLVMVAGSLFYGFKQFQISVLVDTIYPVLGYVLVFFILLMSVLTISNKNRKALAKSLLIEQLSSERIKGELDAAREIQLGSLPDTSSIPNLPNSVHIAANLIPAKEVGGDFYDVFMLDDVNLFFVVADVSGKGIPASLFMALSKALCKSVAVRHDEVDLIMQNTNVEISKENPAMLFMTVLMGVLNTQSGELRFSSAGHEHPLLINRSGIVRTLVSEGGPPLCFDDEYQYPIDVIQMKKGESVLLYTDGVTDAQNTEGQAYGLQRLEDYLNKGVDDKVISNVINGLQESLLAFSKGEDQTDDITILAVQYSG